MPKHRSESLYDMRKRTFVNRDWMRSEEKRESRRITIPGYEAKSEAASSNEASSGSGAPSSSIAAAIEERETRRKGRARAFLD